MRSVARPGMLLIMNGHPTLVDRWELSRTGPHHAQ
jgi:hypothetical protein